MTIPVVATFDYLKSIKREEIKGIFLVFTALPFREKQNTCLFEKVANLKLDTITVDGGNSFRSGTDAVKMADHFEKRRRNK